jgi:hypothetical protein
MGYIAWTLGHVLLDRFDDRLVGAEVVLVPVLASFVMVMWDLCHCCGTMRQLASTICHGARRLARRFRLSRGQGSLREPREMIEAHPAAAETVPANLDRNTFIPLHPGAIRYYRQIGKAGQTD